MGKFIEKYQLLIGLLGGFFILSLIFSGTVYFLGIKDKFAPPAYAASFPSSKAVVAAIPVYDGIIIVKADGTSERKNIGGGDNIQWNPIVALKWAFQEALKAGNFGGVTAFQSGRQVHITNSNGNIIATHGITPPAVNTPACAVGYDQAAGLFRAMYFVGDRYIYRWPGAVPSEMEQTWN